MLDRKLTHDRLNEYSPVRATLALLGQKWVPHILLELSHGKRRFNELGQLVGGCNSRTLSGRLRALQALGIAERHTIATMPPWVEYELTPRGRELAKALDEIKEWGYRNLPSDEVLTAVLADSYTGRDNAVDID